MSIQSRWDATFQKLDRSCPARRADESGINYLRRLSVIGKKYLPKTEQVANVTFKTMNDDVVPIFSEMVREAVERNLTRTDNMAPGEFKTVMRVDPQTGMKVREFYGPRTFTDEFMLRPKRVVTFSVPQREIVWGNNARKESAGLW
jgi:hypothetical protein